MQLRRTGMLMLSRDANIASDRVSNLPSELELTLGLSASAFLLLVVSPIASFALSGFLLINLHARTPREIRWILGLTIALSTSMMAGARPLDPDVSNDIETYYEVYKGLAAGDLSELTRFGAGLEVALPLLTYVFALAMPPLSPNGLMFCFALTSALLVLAWIEKTFYTAKTSSRPALLGIFFVMMNLSYSTQLSRQFLALIVLLYAITAAGRRRQVFFLAIATMFHTTALAFFGIYLLMQRGWVGWIAVVATALVVRLYFGQLLTVLEVLPEAAAEKLVYYVENLEEFTASDIASLRTIFLLCLISAVALLASRFTSDARTRMWLAAPWMTALIHYLLLPIPLASLRTTLVVHSLLPGLLIYKMYSGQARRLAVPVFNVLLAYKLGILATADKSANLSTSFAMLGSFSS